MGRMSEDEARGFTLEEREALRSWGHQVPHVLEAEGGAVRVSGVARAPGPAEGARVAPVSVGVTFAGPAPQGLEGGPVGLAARALPLEVILAAGALGVAE